MKKVKKIAIYGDSLSTGTHGEGGYEGFLKKNFQAEIVNYAVGSSGLSFASPNNAASILIEPQNIPEDADVVFMWHGTNDWYWGCPIGNIEDETPDTFYGAIKTAVCCIRKKVPDAVLIWASPLFRLEKPDGMEKEGAAYQTKNKAGFTLEAYYDAVIRAGVYYGFPVIDMRRFTGIHEENHELYLEDKVHPNRAGYEKIEKVLEKGMKEILYYAGYEV